MTGALRFVASLGTLQLSVGGGRFLRCTLRFPISQSFLIGIGIVDGRLFTVDWPILLIVIRPSRECILHGDRVQLPRLKLKHEVLGWKKREKTNVRNDLQGNSPRPGGNVERPAMRKYTDFGRRCSTPLSCVNSNPTPGCFAPARTAVPDWQLGYRFRGQVSFGIAAGMDNVVSWRSLASV